MKLKEVKIGADIEMFLKERETNRIVSAEGYIKGSKDEPFVFDEDNKYFAVSLDNVAAEFCIPPVNFGNVNDWMFNIKKSLAYINGSIPEKLCTVALPSAELEEIFLQTENAKRFGCMPDYNVWQRGLNPSPKAKNSRLRSCGGHIHIGYLNALDLGIDVMEELVKAMDLFVAIPSIIQEPDNERKRLYGKAGAFRDKPYGVEYRTISNYYVDSDGLMQWVFNNTMAAVNFVNDERMEEIESVKDTIVEAINKSNKVMAGNLIRQFDIQMA